MPPKRNHEPAILSSSKRILRKRKQPHEAAIHAVAAATPSPKRNQRKRKQPQETAIPAATLIRSSASLPRRKRAKKPQPETTMPALAAGSSTLPEPTTSLTYDQAQTLVRQLITLPRQGLDSEDTNIDSKVKYAEAALRVGLEPYKVLQDIPTFEIHRSRIRTDIFKAIMTDLDTMLLQYGPPNAHKNEEARSRFFSPVFNHLVKQFTFMLRIEPETMLESRIGTRGRVKYFFKAFGTVAILCIEMKLKVGNDEERLDAIAQVIAECDSCELNNGDKGYLLPVHCILSDGLTFEFFKFSRDRFLPRSSFFRGCFLGDPEHLKYGLVLPDTKTMEPTLPFILQLRRICETIFDIMLNAYIFAINAFHDRSISKSKGMGDGMKRSSLDQALKLANGAVATLREADNQRAKGDIASADTSVLEGFRLLNESTAAVSTVYRSKLYMTGWNDDEVRKA